jgi:hypothetical protein
MLSGIELRDGVAFFDSASVDETREVVEVIAPPGRKRKCCAESDTNHARKQGGGGDAGGCGDGGGEGEAGGDGGVRGEGGEAGAPSSSSAATPTGTARIVRRITSDVRVRIRIGKNHIVRRLVAAAGLPCLELHRSMVRRAVVHPLFFWLCRAV